MALALRRDQGEFGWNIETAPGRAGKDNAGEMVLPYGWKSKQQNDRSHNISTTIEGKDKIILQWQGKEEETSGGKKRV